MQKDATSIDVLFHFRVNVNDVDDPDQGYSTIEDNVIEGMTSTDMSNDIASCLASWYLSLHGDDVEVATIDAIAVQPAKDGRKNKRFEFSRRGGIRQTN